MDELVALDLPGGTAFIDALRRVWDDGDAALPLDSHAPPAQKRRVLDAMVPAAVIGADGVRRTLSGGRPVESGDAVVIATSGTTGSPKGAVHTHAGLAAAAAITAAGAAALDDDVRWLACLPLAHVGGFSVITRALLSGAGLEVHDRADADRIDEAARRGATHVSLVPTLLGRVDASLWQAILLGGTAIPAERPANTIATYGMTETFGGVIYDGVPLAGVEVRIDGPGSRDVPTGGIGRIELRSPTLLRSYRDGVVPVDPHGWFRTGDLGTVDRAGVLSVVGRADDLIITGGTNVWPGPVEDVLRGDPDVSDVAVFGREDAEWGQRVVAVVVPTDPSAPPTLGRLRARVKENLGAAAAPKELVLADVLPRTALGKIMRHELAGHPGGLEAGGTQQGPTDAQR